MVAESAAAYDHHRAQQAMLAVNLGLAVNIFLALAKTGIGIVGHSPALLADGVNSISDVAYYVVISIFIRLSQEPADDEHPYGHSQLESIAALVIGAFVMTTAITIFWQAVNEVFDQLTGIGDFSGASYFALGMAMITVLIKIGLFVFTRRIGQQTQNPAVAAMAYDHRNDIFTATAATVGIALGRAGFPWVDPLAGALVALVILRTGIEILRASAEELMDTVPGPELNEQINKLVGSIVGVRQIEEIKAHRFGPYLVVNITVGVDGGLTVEAGDQIATNVERSLLDNIPLMRRVHVHYHPAKLVG